MTVTTFRPHTLGEAAVHATQYADGTEERIYWQGVVDAFLFESDPQRWRDHFESLTLDPDGRMAQPLPFEQTGQMIGMLARNYSKRNLPRVIRASGALWGYLEATAHHEDAAECASCGRRILTDREEGHEVCEHPGRDYGTVHQGDCHVTLCGPLAGGEPEWNPDLYYADKYGDEY